MQIYQKSLFLVGHPSDGSAVQDDDLRMSLLPSLTSGARSMEQVSAFTPQLNYLSESELEKNEKDREKDCNDVSSDSDKSETSSRKGHIAATLESSQNAAF